MNDETNASEKLAALDDMSTALNQALQQILEALKASKAGGAGREYSVRMTIDLPESLPRTLRPPDRANTVGPGPPRRIRVAGTIAEYPILASAQVTATVTVYGSLGEKPSTGMNRSTWFLPLDRERRSPAPEVALDRIESNLFFS